MKARRAMTFLLCSTSLPMAALADTECVVLLHGLARTASSMQPIEHALAADGYEVVNGPAGMQLGTDADSVPRSLGPVDFPLGVIAGTRTFNPILSLSLPNPDDGKVSVDSTKVEGMTDFITLPHTHTFMMRAEAVIRQVRHFLKRGTFLHASGD